MAKPSHPVFKKVRWLVLLAVLVLILFFVLDHCIGHQFALGIP